ncbi:MAG: hypothetical protein ACQEXX_24830 [Bacillota bacterium]
MASVIWYWTLTNAKKEEVIVQRATVVGKKYFKDEFNIDVVFTSHDIQSGYTGRSVALYGNIVDLPKDKVMVLINYREYKVVAAQVPETIRDQGKVKQSR